MTNEEINDIETALGIRLPEDYRELVQLLPVVRDRGTTDGPAWDVPSELIRHNLHLRRKRGWPSHLYCLGEDGGGSQFVLDLRETTPVVLQTDFEELEGLVRVEHYDRPAPLSIRAWYYAYVEDLQNDGIDISQARQPEAPASRLELMFDRVLVFVFLAAILVLVAAGALSVLKRISGWPPISVRRVTQAALIAFAVSGAIMMWLGREKRPAA